MQSSGLNVTGSKKKTTERTKNREEKWKENTDEDEGSGFARQNADVHLLGVVDAMEADPGDQLDVLAVADDQIYLLIERACLFRIYQRFQLEPFVLQQFLCTRCNNLL